MLTKVISGGQTGADVGGLRAAKRFGLLTGGKIPRNYLTENGYKPELGDLYGLECHTSDKYPPRTYDNAKNSDGTIRFAKKWRSSGEILTLKAVSQYNKPHIDVDFYTPIPHEEVVDWIVENDIKVLNVAGNCESTCRGLSEFVDNYLFTVFTLLQDRGWILCQKTENL